ncbi:MAG TPA: hypothetical protein VND68_00710, partial [Chloroflexia bacterium]|nr:hypothetical protein [Chloroflexia bacterium]
MTRGRIAGAVALCALCVLLSIAPVIRGTFALLTAGTTNPNARFATTSLYAPTGLQASPSGRSGALSWAAGQNGNGYKVLGLGNGTSSACPAATSASYTAITTTTGLSYIDANRSPASVPQGTWYCYQVQTSYQSWSSVLNNPVAGVQVGVVATSAQLVNLSASKLDTGDQFIFTFNQAIDTSSGPVSGNSVCSNGTTIWIGSTATSGGCAVTETVNVGKITGGTLVENTRWAATYAWSNGNTRLTVTLGARIAGNKAPVLSASTWTFTPTTTSTKLLSAAGAFHICDSNTGGGSCTPTLSIGTSAAAAGAQQSAAQSAGADAGSVPATATATPSKAITATSTLTPTATSSPTSTRTATSTPQAASASATPSSSPIPSHTPAPPTASATASATSSPTSTKTPTSTATATRTSTSTATASATASPSRTPTASATATATATETMAASPTATASATSQATATAGP